MTDKPQRADYWRIAQITKAMNDEHLWRFGRKPVADLRPIIKSTVGGESVVAEADKLKRLPVNRNVPRSSRFFDPDRER